MFLLRIAEILLYIFGEDSPSISIAVVGLNGAGKTTLYNAIRQEGRSVKTGTKKEGEPLKKCKVTFDDTQFVIKKGKDWDGDKTTIKEYEDLFKNKNIIILMFDCREWEKDERDKFSVNPSDGYKMRVIQRMNVVFRLIKDKDKRKIVLGSHIDKLENHTWEEIRDELRHKLVEELGREDIYNCFDSYEFVNLTDKEQRDDFLRRQIFKHEG